jgi:hypothetical protein
MSEGPQKRGNASVYIKTHHALTVIMENANPSLVTEGWVCVKPRLVTVDTRACITVARPDNTAGWPERQPNQRFTLQTVSREAFSIFKEVS